LLNDPTVCFSGGIAYDPPSSPRPRQDIFGRKKVTALRISTFGVIVLFPILLVCCGGGGGSGGGASDSGDKTMSELDVPANFDFETVKTIQITINDAEDQIKYDLYTYDENAGSTADTWIDDDGETVSDRVIIKDEQDRFVCTGITQSGLFETTATVPAFYTKLYLVRNEKGVFYTEIVDIVNDTVEYTHSQIVYGPSGHNPPMAGDILYGVNGEADIFTIDPVTGVMTVIGTMPMGSWTCAIDKVSRKLYTIGRSSPFPLRSFDLDTHDWNLVANLGMGGPRLDYNYEDGLLYFSRKDTLYTIDPSNGKVLSSLPITGIHNVAGGDVKFAADGTLFLGSFSGLYGLEFEPGDTISADRISAEDLTFSITSMTIDTGGTLWLADNLNNANLIVMDTVTGAYEYRFTPYGIGINDLTTLPVDSGEIPDTDTDSDGVIDYYDDYPDDGELAFDVYTPSEFGWGSLAFEDLWPSKGDYDFNDLVVYYRIIKLCNADNDIAKLECTFKVKNIGGDRQNGLGFQLPLLPAQVSEVTGYELSNHIVTLDAKGLEAGQSKATVIVFENAWYHEEDDITVLVTFTDPIDPDLLGTPPFNPFMFIDLERGKELHLVDHEPTDLANLEYLGTEDDSSNPGAGRYYKTAKNLPWAINIVHQFRWPVERKEITRGYNHFGTWAETGGVRYLDWYKDTPGYRNDDFLETE